jgi:hypothetical protein
VLRKHTKLTTTNIRKLTTMSKEIISTVIELSEEQLDEVAGGSYDCHYGKGYKQDSYKKDCGYEKKEYYPKQEYKYDKKYGC